MTERHLGDSLHDLLDGRLSRDKAHDAMAHLAQCDDCTREWNELRAAREALNSSQAGIDMRFAQSLIDRDRMAEIAKGESKHRARAARGRPHRAPYALIMASVVVAVVVAAYVVGAPRSIDPADEILAEGAEGAAVDTMAATALREGVAMDTWVQPDWEASGLIPVEASVYETTDGSQLLVARLLAGADAVVLIEQVGALVSASADWPRMRVGERDVLIVSSDPLQVMWQSRSHVLAAGCRCSQDTLAAVIGAFPADGQPGAVQRIAAGFTEFAHALSGG